MAPYYSDSDISPDARKLIIFADNTESLYNQKVSIAKNLIKKIAAGKYDRGLAAKGWGYWFNSAAKSYEKEYGHLFSASVRREAAKSHERVVYDELLDIAAGKTK